MALAKSRIVKLSHDLESASLGAVLRTALDAVVVMRLDGTIAGWNDVAERTFGWSFDEARGRRMSEMIIPERYRTAHEQGLAHYLATGEGPVLDRHFEIEALHRAGHELPVELSITRTEQFGEPVFLGFLRDISERRDAARRQELLIGELNHRVKNMLGVVSGIAHQTARNSSDIAGFSEAFDGRLMSLASAHEILTGSSWEVAPLVTLMDALLAAYRDEAGQVSWHGDDVELDSRQLLSMGMIVHELLTNAIKYGALSQPGGRLAITWRREAGWLNFAWDETGLEGVTPPARLGFGSKMIKLSAGHELRGRLTTEWATDGVRHRLAFPLERIGE